MTMHDHDTDHPQDDRDEVEPGYFERDDATDVDDTDVDDTDTIDDEGAIDTEGLADPDADPEAEAGSFDEPIALGPTTDADENEDTSDEGDDVPSGVTAAPAPGEDADADAENEDLAAEPVIVELDETEVEVLDDPDADDGAVVGDDESVLLTETTDGSVLPPEDTDETEVEPELEVEAVEDTDDDVDDEPVADDEPVESADLDPVARLAPAAAGEPIDPGSGTYQERWSAIQGTFVDEPYRAVESAGALVAQMWHEFERSISDRRDTLDASWADDSATDDLREAFQQYRELFRRFQSLLDDA